MEHETAKSNVRAHDGNVHCVKVVNSFIISCSADKTTRIWNLEDGKLLKKLHHSKSCSNFDLNLKTMLLAVAHRSGVTLWDFLTKTKIKDIDLAGSVADLRFNQSGKILIIGKHDGEVFKADIN